MYVLNETIIGGISVNTAYPVGSLYFGEGVNPNTVFSGTSWIRTGKGQVMLGVDESDSDYSAARKTGGAKTVTLAAAQLPSHTHTFTGAAVNSNAVSHTHKLLVGDALLWDRATSINAPALKKGDLAGTGHLSTTGAHTHTTGASTASTLANTGSGGAHNNLQPFVVCEIWERIA